MSNKNISDMTDDELRRRALELVEEEHREREKASKRRARIRLVLLVLLVLTLVFVIHSCNQLGQDLRLTS